MGLHGLRGPGFAKGHKARSSPWPGSSQFPGPAHLARALGTGLIVQGEHLAVHHLPSLVVAVCGGQRRQGPMRAKAHPGASDGGWRVPLTLAHWAALPIGVEGVGAGDRAVHG